ncbi:MAG: ribulokinase [Firmicutes bacterium]|nr:ribulokinase [Bacillota bacterium]
MDNEQYVLGLDFGTDSVRALLIETATGREMASAVSYYPRWAKGLYCDPDKNQFRQHPLDYIESMEAAVKGALAKMPTDSGARVVGIGVDTTGSTPCAIDRNGRPLALREEYRENPNAMFILWKDHTAVREAAEINQIAKNWGGVDYTKYEGGVYSSEWFWAKILHVLREDIQIREHAYSWIEHCDWIPALLTGVQNPAALKRSRCAAGHKAMWHQDWNGLPDEEFLTRIDPLLAGLRERLYQETYTSDVKAGNLTAEWAERLGLKPGIAVAVGAFDAHMGAVGAEISEATLVKIMGTSTCDIMIAAPEVIGDKLIAGICGQVDGSVIPGYIGLEAGQSAYGDVYAWFRQLLCWPLEAILTETSLVSRELVSKLKAEIESKILTKLAAEAAQIQSGETTLIALDWLNGRRTPYADQTLKGAVAGLTLGTSAPKFYRALVKATAFGAKAIVEHFRDEGIAINQVIAIGGIAKKSDFVMQVTADVLNMPIKVARSEQACALGAGMFGAVAAGVYSSVSEAQTRMSSGFDKTYTPQPEAAQKYQKSYQRYQELGKILEEQLQTL